MNNLIEQFELSDGERLHPLWLRLKAHFETLLQSRRLRNDKVDASEQETAALRGEIRLLKVILDLENDPPQTD